MKNVIMFYYSINPAKIYQKNHKYWFTYQGYKYLFIEYSNLTLDIRDVSKLIENLHQINIPVHDLVFNNNNQMITNVEGRNFVLMKQIVKDGYLSLQDIINFSDKTMNLIVLLDSYKKRKSWKKLWSDKIDFFEYQISQFGMKYSFLRESFDYFVGLAENAIAYCNEINDHYYSISHKRLERKTTYEEFYNPLELIADFHIRDIAEYFKFKLFNGYLSFHEVEYFLKYHIHVEEYKSFYARFLFPTPYFDLFENIIDGKKDEKSIHEMIKKIPTYENFLKEIYEYMIHYTKMPMIEWITKKHR